MPKIESPLAISCPAHDRCGDVGGELEESGVPEDDGSQDNRRTDDDEGVDERVSDDAKERHAMVAKALPLHHTCGRLTRSFS